MNSTAAMHNTDIFNVEYDRDKARTEIKNYLNAMFLQVFKPDGKIKMPPGISGTINGPGNSS